MAYAVTHSSIAAAAIPADHVARALGHAGAAVTSHTKARPATERRALDTRLRRIMLSLGKPPTFIEPFEAQHRDLEQEAAKHGAPALATKLVYLAVIVAVVVLVFVLGVGHLPRGG